MKKKEILAELRGKEVETLQTQARDVAEELMRLRCRQVTGQLEQLHHFRELRCSLARVQTVIREKSLNLQNLNLENRSLEKGSRA